MGSAGASLTAYSYDPADQLLSTQVDNGAVTTFGYDANGSRIHTTLPSGLITSYAWDAANRLQAIELPSNGGIYTQTYRSDGLRHSQTLPSTRGNGVQVSLWDEASGGNLAPLSWKGRVGTGASLLASDATTQGTWHNVFGSDGFVIADGGTSLSGASNLPRYAQVGFGTAANELWQASTSDVRALQKPNALTDRIAAAYHVPPNPLVPHYVPTVTVDLNLADERPHIVSLYLLDWDNVSRQGALTITDTQTNATLYTQNISGYGNGLWLRFRISGQVTITITNTSATSSTAGAVLSAVFFDAIPESTSTNGSTDLLAQVFGQGGMGDELLSASGSTRHNLAVGRQYHEDAQGTIEATTAIAGAAGGTVGSGGTGSVGSGSVQSAFAVDAWGNPLSASFGTGQDGRSVEDNPFLFLGGLGYWQEPDLGLSYVRARWLDTSTAQWMNVDPVDGEPRYNYAYQSPTMREDPSGMEPPRNLLEWLSNPLDPIWRKIYADDWRAPDSVYNPAIGAGSDVLADYMEAVQTDGFHGFVEKVLKPALGLIHTFEETAEGAYRKQVGTLEAKYGRLLSTLHLSRNSSRTSRKPKTTRRNGGSNTASGKATEQFHASDLLFLQPPSYVSKQAVAYWGGYYWGVGSSLLSFLRQGIDLVEVFVSLYGKPHIWSCLWDMAKGIFGDALKQIKKTFTNLANRAYYDRGKIVGAIIGFIVQIVLIIIHIPQVWKVLKGKYKSAIEAIGQAVERGGVKENAAALRRHIGLKIQQGTNRAIGHVAAQVERAQNLVRKAGNRLDEARHVMRSMNNMGQVLVPAGGAPLPPERNPLTQWADNELEKMKARLMKMAGSSGSGRNNLPKNPYLFVNKGTIQTPVGKPYTLYKKNGFWKVKSPSGVEETARGRYLFVRTPNNEYLAWPDDEPAGLAGIGHTSLSQGRPVLWAGEIEFGGTGEGVSAGRVAEWTGGSGHYFPEEEDWILADQYKTQAGLPLKTYLKIE